MSKSLVDWSVLRGAVTVFVICFAVAGVLLSASFYFREAMELEYRNNHANFREVSRKYLAVDEEERIVHTLYPRFVKLYESGVLGQEHRLSWLESLRSSGDRIRLPEISYRLHAQSVYQPDFPIDAGAYNVYVSEMALELGLLHEGDLFDLLDDLSDQADGLYSVSRCEAVRTGHPGEIDLLRPTINASCWLNWFTIDLKGDRKLTL